MTFAKTDRPTEWVHYLDTPPTVCEGEVSEEVPGLGICLDHDRRVQRQEVEPDLSQTIEILHTRDPDGDCGVQLFVGGQLWNGNVNVVDLDPGRGYRRSDWEESKEYDTTHGSPMFCQAVTEAYEAFDNNQYIEEDR